MGKLQMYQDHWVSTNIWGTWRMWSTSSIRPWSTTPTMFHSRVSKDWGKNLTRDRCIVLYVTHCYITCILNSSCQSSYVIFFINRARGQYGGILCPRSLYRPSASPRSVQRQREKYSQFVIGQFKTQSYLRWNFKRTNYKFGFAWLPIWLT